MALEGSILRHTIRLHCINGVLISALGEDCRLIILALYTFCPTLFPFS